MGVRFDLRDAKDAVNSARRDVRQLFEKVGHDAVAYAKANGNYKNQTGHLRASNYFDATETRLEIGNSAEYASDVESKGYDVVGGAYFNARKELGI